MESSAAPRDSGEREASQVGGRHVSFVERRARERADELQCLPLCRDFVQSSCLFSRSLELSLGFPGEDNYLEYEDDDRRPQRDL